MQSTAPVSRFFGTDRGTPIDRYYIEKFLDANRKNIHGRVLEIAESTYTKKFGNNVSAFEVLHADDQNPNATIIGDLSMLSSLPVSVVDCFICTQTFNFIFNVKEAISGAHQVLAPGGVLLATVSGISQISRYDADRWGDYWRFTTSSATRLFEDVFGVGNVEIDYEGNCFAVISFLRGISLEEVSVKDIDLKDADYPLIITIIARK